MSTVRQLIWHRPAVRRYWLHTWLHLSSPASRCPSLCPFVCSAASINA